MKISHLKFAQLHQLTSLPTLCRVTRTFHSALRTAWNANTPGGQIFTVSAAQFRFPAIARRYRRVLAFLTSDDLKRHVRLVAEVTPIRLEQHGFHRIRSCDYWTDQGKKEAFELARLCKSFCEALEVPAQISHKHRVYHVTVSTDVLGVAVLREHPGVSVLTIARFLDFGNCPLRGPFWWLPRGTAPTARVNPLLRCINTPDTHTYAKSIIFQ